MRSSRIIGVGFFISVLFLLGVIVETKASLAQTACSTAAQYRGQNGQQITCVCPANFGFGSVWGTGVYTDDSSICTAAVHAGVITQASGGTVTIEIRPGQSGYNGTAGYGGVTSTSYGSWSGSFVFVTGGTTQTQQYLGCWRDDANRVLNGYQVSYVGDMTNGRCIAICRERGFPFAGTQYSGHCFCGNSYDRLGRLDETQCNMTCAGNPGEKCGGPWANSVYAVGSVQPPQQQQANRAPNAPTLLSPPSTYQPPIAINPQNPYVQLSWQNNGDPENDPLSSWLNIRYWDYNSQTWKDIFADYVQGTLFTLTQPRLAYNTYYAWTVAAIDTTQRSNPWYTWASNWSLFLTGPNPQGGDITIEIQP